MRDTDHLMGLVAAVLAAGMLGCAHSQSRTISAAHSEFSPPMCRLDLSWQGDPKDLALTMTWQNVGRVPVLVDSELVLFVELSVHAPDGSPIELETVRQLPRPSEKQIRDRVVTLGPGDAIERTIRLSTGFKYFRWQWTYPDPDSVVSSEVLCRIPEGVRVGEVMADYMRPGLLSSIHEPVPRYTMNYGLPAHLYQGPVLGRNRLSALGADQGRAGPEHTAGP